MATLDKNSYEGKFNSPTTGLLKDNTTGDISAADARTLVEDLVDSVPFTNDDSYIWSSPKVETAGVNTYTGTLSPAITAYTNGMKVHVKIKDASTGASTLNLNAVGAKKIFVNPTTQAGNGHLTDEQHYLMVYDSALDTAAGGWLIIGSGSSSSSGTSIPFGTTSGTNTYTIAATPAVSSYSNGALFLIKVASGSTNLSTFNFDSVGAKKAYATPEEQISDGYLEDNRYYLFSYDTALDGGAGGFIQVNESNHSLVNMITGGWDASGGLLPSTTGSGPSGAIKHGDAFIITTGGTVGSAVLSNKDWIIAAVDTPGQTLGNWLLISGLLSTDIKLATKTDQLTTFRRLTASHTLDATDLASINNGDDLVIEMNVASANDLTIPLNATVAFPIGTKITIIQYGAGQTSVVATGGVTANTSSGDFLSRNQYAPMLLEKVATDEWYLSNGTTPGSIVSAGTWTPTLTNTTNVAASTAYACQYMRVGATVTVSGKVSIDPTTTGDTVLGMSIPIPSAFSQEFHAGGVAAAYAVEGLSVAILADATNDRLTFRFTAVDTSNRDFFFSATYQII